MKTDDLNKLNLPWTAGDDNAMLHGTPKNPDQDEPPFLADFCAEPGMYDPDDAEALRAQYAAQAANAFFPMLSALRAACIHITEYGKIETGTPESAALIAGWKAAKGDGPVDINLPGELAKLPTYGQLLAYVEQIARMTKEGDMVDGKEFVMENNDAFDTATRLISDARNILGLPDVAGELDPANDLDTAGVPEEDALDALQELTGESREVLTKKPN